MPKSQSTQQTKPAQLHAVRTSKQWDALNQRIENAVRELLGDNDSGM